MNIKLFDNELISFVPTEDQTSQPYDAEEINNKYIKGEIRIVTEQARYPLPSIIVMLASGDYKLNPEFQRRHRWNVEQKSKLIESFIMNVPIPPVFMYEDSYSHYEVMDGLQRLTAIKSFYIDEFALQGLEEWPELNNKKYSELPSQIKKGIDRRYLSSIILLKETAHNEVDAQKLKQLVFERINSGGVQLEPQESRNAVYNGPFNDMCIKLARNEYLCRTWDIPLPSDSEEQNELPEELIQNPLFSNMGDVELVLRFFANRQRKALFKGSKNFKEFLNQYLRAANLLTRETRVDLENIFKQTIEFLYELLGEKAFCLFRQRNGQWSWYNRPTTAVYDPLTLVASQYLDKKEKILERKGEIISRLEDFYTLNYSKFEGRNTNPTIILERETLIDSLFKSLL